MGLVFSSIQKAPRSISDYLAEKQASITGKGLQAQKGDFINGQPTIAAMKAAFDEFSVLKLSHPDIFIVEVTSPIAGGGISAKSAARAADNFRLLVTSVSYDPITIEAESRQIGSGYSTVAKMVELVGAIQITAYDTRDGALKKLFRSLSNVAVRNDGTVGLPSEYAVGLKIWHDTPVPKLKVSGTTRKEINGPDVTDIENETVELGAVRVISGASGYFDHYPACRPVSLNPGELDRAMRSEHSKIVMTFAQICTFME